MNTTFRRLSGVFLVLLALAGLVVTVYSLQRVFGLKEALSPRIEAELELADESLRITNQAIDVVEAALKTASSNISTMRDALLTLAQSVHDAVPILNSLSTLTGKTLPDTITATQASLITAQTTAKTIEDILQVITRIPLMPGEPYDPEVPLYIALGQITKDLDKINPQLNAMDKDLADSKTSLAALENDIIQITQDLQLINGNLNDAVKVLSQYRNLVNRLQTRLDTLKGQIPGWIAAITIFLVFILVWIAIYQVDLLIRGYKLIRAQS